MKALFINVEKQTVTEVEITNWKQIAPLIGNGCRLFTCPVEFEKQDTLYADDEGILNNVVGGIIMKNWEYPILGNQLVCGASQSGNLANVKMSIDELTKMIQWVSKEQAQRYANNFI